MSLNFSNEDLMRAKETNLVELARALGYTPFKCGGCYSLKEMDSIRIYNERTWYRWSGTGNKKGGTQIDFLIEFGKANDIPEAVHQLLNFQGIAPVNVAGSYSNNKEKENIILKLPEKAHSYRILYAYLMKQRGLSYDVIDYFVNKQKILYESSEHHNLVFVGRDKSGNIKFATQRGTGDIYGRKFKGDVSGSNKDIGISIVNSESKELYVFESSIDCMSYIDLTGDYSRNKLIMNTVEENALVRFLNDYSYIKSINFCLDNDTAAKDKLYGKDAITDFAGKIIKDKIVGYIEKYNDKGYIVNDKSAPAYPHCKDYNEVLRYLKASRPDMVYSCCEKRKVVSR